MSQFLQWYILKRLIEAESHSLVTTVMELVNHKARTMLLCPLYSPAHLNIRSGNRGFSP